MCCHIFNKYDELLFRHDACPRGLCIWCNNNRLVKNDVLICLFLAGKLKCLSTCSGVCWPIDRVQ